MLDYKDSSKRSEWKALWENKAYLGAWLSSLLSVMVVLKLWSIFLLYNESRAISYQINDWVLANVEPIDVSIPLFTITWACIFIFLPFSLRTPSRSITVLLSIILITIYRCFTIYLVPLEAPIGIIPLRDFLLEGSFYDNQVLVKDLFFSGHTANLALLFFLVDVKWMKIVLGISTLIVAFLLLVQHVHYTIDVLAAPLFAYFAYAVGSLITKKILELVKRNPKIDRKINVPAA